MYSGVHDGAASGYLSTTNINPTVGVRYKFSQTRRRRRSTIRRLRHASLRRKKSPTAGAWDGEARSASSARAPTPCCRPTTRPRMRALDQRRRALQGIAHHGFRALGAVGKPRGISQIDEILAGIASAQSPQYRQTADARIEDADRDARRQDSGRMCGNSRTSRIDGEFVYSMTSRSTPKPSPAAGGMPYSSART